MSRLILLLSKTSLRVSSINIHFPSLSINVVKHRNTKDQLKFLTSRGNLKNDFERIDCF